VIHIRQRPDESSPEIKNVASTRLKLALAFQPLCVQFVPDVDGGELGLYVVQHDADGGNTFLIDDVALQEVP